MQDLTPFFPYLRVNKSPVAPGVPNGIATTRAEVSGNEKTFPDLPGYLAGFARE